MSSIWTETSGLSALLLLETAEVFSSRESCSIFASGSTFSLTVTATGVHGLSSESVKLMVNCAESLILSEKHLTKCKRRDTNQYQKRFISNQGWWKLNLALSQNISTTKLCYFFPKYGILSFIQTMYMFYFKLLSCKPHAYPLHRPLCTDVALNSNSATSKTQNCLNIMWVYSFVGK